jgi:hypothetical protein
MHLGRGISQSIATATWAAELVRRLKFDGQGKGVLFLWREIAWEGTAPKRGFALTAEDIIAAERAIVRRMEQFA